MKRKKVASSSPPWVELPEDVTEKILQMLGPIEILVNAQGVCSTWRKICRDPSMWRVIDMRNLGDDHYQLPYHGREALCRLAVDLSQGQATEISIADFGSEHLLDYIARSCGHLKRLRLAFCEDVDGETLSRAVKGFPKLEELRLERIPVEKDDIEAIGQSCPMLKSFALIGRRNLVVTESNEEALAVATYMPELRHLQLFGNEMTDDALDSILDGCPKLESLDLWNCFNLNLEVERGERCAQQIEIPQASARPH